MSNGLCNQCGSTKMRVVFRKNVAQINQIVQCMDCGLMFAYPLNVDPESEYWEGTDDSKAIEERSYFNDQRVLLMIRQKEQIQVGDYLTSMDFVEKLYPNRGKALEIGSSSGFFLHELTKRGWDIVGVEPSIERRQSARDLFGFEFIPDKIEELKLPEQTFDAIFMFHVIEHLLDPSSCISRISRLLKPGGIFAIETPTYDSVSFKILRHRERSVRCSGHFFFFTKKSLRNMVEKNNLTVVRHDRVGRTLTLERFIWNITIVTRIRLMSTFIATIVRLLRLDKIKVYLNVGDMQRIYCVRTPRLKLSEGGS